MSKLTDAAAEQRETEHWILTAQACGYLRNAAATGLLRQLDEVGRMPASMVRKSELFCGSVCSAGIRESLAPYFASDSAPDEPAET